VAAPVHRARAEQRAPPRRTSMTSTTISRS